MIQTNQPEANDLLCEFTNAKQQEIFTIKRDIYIENQHSLRQDQSTNPNQTIRKSRAIYQNYVNLIRSVNNFISFLRNYRNVLAINAQRKRFASLQYLSPEDQMRKAQFDQISLPLIINKIVLFKQKQEKQAINYAINKLKCMVMKARYKESTMLQYLTQTYIVKLKNAIIYNVKYREDKGQKSRLIQLQAVRNQFIYKSVEMIKKRYQIIEVKKLNFFKIKPTAYFNQIKRGLIEEKPVFFINFFTESLLFIDQIYINFNETLLFCPIVLENSETLKISNFYQTTLSKKINEYTQFQLYVQVYHIETVSSDTPIFYSKLIDTSPNNLRKNKQVPERVRQQSKRLEKLLDHIDLIRRSVFGKMILHWLCTIFDLQTSSIEIIIQEKFRVVIFGSSQPRPYQIGNPSEMCDFCPQIVANLILLGGDRKNVQKGRRQLKEAVRSQIEAIIFKLISEKVLSRVSWPLQCNSIGQYYYQYSSDRIINRTEVKKFFAQF